MSDMGHSVENDAPTETACTRCGLTARAAIAGVLCEPPHGRRHDWRDPAPETVRSPYHHEDERECYYRADGSGWWPWRFEDGVLNRSAGTVCYRTHPDPTRVIPPAEGDA